MPEALSVLTDSDWAGCKRTRRSTSGFAIFLGQHLLAFGSRTQKNIALSSGEAELAAQVCGVSEALGIANLMHEWKITIKVKSFCDSSAARGILQRVGCGRIRHLQLKHLWIQELVSSERLHVQWIPRKENCADILTHPTAVSEFDKGLAGMGVRRLGRAAKNEMHSGRGVCWEVWVPLPP